MLGKYDRLAPGAKKLLEVMAIPGNDELSVIDQCKLAGISRQTYYNYFDNPAFVKAYDKLTQDLIKAAVVPMIKASVREGRKGSYQDRKMVLEMAGTYQNKSSIDLEVRGFEDLLQGLAADSSEEP